MSDFRFANPTWFHAMWLVAAWVVLLLVLDWRRGDVLSRLLSVTMQSRLVRRLSRTRRWVSIGLLGLAGAAMVVALMRPQWGLTYREMPRVGAQIMVCLDVSKSMLAEDTAPNRLERAKVELSDLLGYLEGDQVGLIAFAGRAAVLCPLTPDFGFFKLILDGAGTHSVGRGGTRLEEPIRKALDGFRTEADVSRVIVLITDGEDHDSHPIDAAKAAAERGIKILTVGFGDEAGSEIQYTDPQTGARTVVRDANGAPVVSRLDGETLREIAMETEGAYIPAGTGALDLKSIYDAHIAPLVRGRQDTRGHAVRHEGFQWAVLAALVLLVASVVVGSGSARSESMSPVADARRSLTRRAGAATLLVALALPSPVQGQQPEPGAEPPADLPADGVVESPAATPDAKDEATEQRDPRDIYNDALALLDTDFDRAEELLTEARRESGTDGEVRFRATYNLGWVEVKRADRAIADRPEEALAHLRGAADWFRDAIRLRPDHRDARHNLEVVLQRILELADLLAKKDDRNLTERLDALIEGQRDLVATARQLVGSVAAEDDPNGAERFRSEFRQLAVEQRKLLSDGQALSSAAGEELDALNGKDDSEKTPQENVRAARLTGVLHYMNRGAQRMGQARSQMRRRQAERAFRRAAVALDELKRARDQMREPVEVLDVILADALSLAQLTSLKAASTNAPLGIQTQAMEPPAWLTAEYLDESQLAITERTSELVALLQAGLDQQASRPAGPPSPSQQKESAEADRFLAMVREAMPFLNRGKEALESAGQSLAAEELGDASRRQLEAIAALRQARERFLQLRGLIEMAYSREVQTQQLLPPPPAELALSEPVAPKEQPPSGEKEETADETPPSDDTKPVDAQDAEPPAESPAPEPPEPQMPIEQQVGSLQIARALQKQNLDRAERIAGLIDKDLRELPEAVAPEDGTDAATQQAEQAEAQRKQLELAKQVLSLARREMEAAAESLAKSTTTTEPDDAVAEPPRSTAEVDEVAVEASRAHVAQAVEHLQELRRMFFSLIEHLRETAQRQAQLNDETEQVAGLEQGDDLAAKTGPLAMRQQELRSVTGEIAKTLEEQAKQPPPNPQQGADPKQLQQLQQHMEQLAQAAKLVAKGGDEMDLARQSLTGDEPAPDQARPHQDQALEKLIQALALLQPQQPNQQPQNQPQQQQDQQQQQQQGQQDQQQQQQLGTDPARLLQAIRDREAQRRRDREQRGRIQQEPVEKDW